MNKISQRSAAIIIILTLVFFTGCKRDTNYLAYQERAQSFTAEITLKESGEKYKAALDISPEGSRMTFILPENIKNLSYERKNGRTTALLQGIEYEGDFLIPDTVFSLFSLNKDSLISARKGEGGNILTFDGQIILTLDKSNNPLCIECPLLTLNISEQTALPAS